MPPIFSPSLVNDPFGDPVLYVDFRYEHRALLCDLGDLSALPPRKILRISDVLVSHTHMDHFCGFDRLLRICLGRDTSLRLFGPPGFVAQVGHKLESYTWNLVDRYPGDFVLDAWEVDGEGRGRGTRYRCRRGFRGEGLGARRFDGGVLIDEPAFRVRSAVLDHGTPCLGFAIEEKQHVNIWKNRLAERGLPVGPWLNDLREAAARGDPDDTPIRAAWHDRDGDHERVFTLGWLKTEVLRFVPGETICYVTDVAWTGDNARRIVALAEGAARFYVECAFLDEEAGQAARKYHLTARQAGVLARQAGVAIVVPLHFSPRYMGREEDLRAELDAARREAASQPGKDPS